MIHIGGHDYVLKFTWRALSEIEQKYGDSPNLFDPDVIAVIAAVDLVSAGLIVLTIPLIPIFGILIGLMTRDRTQAKLNATARQQSMLLDLIAGIPTLRAVHRAQGAAKQVEELGTSWRRSTMSTLRVAFLSGAWLELMATLSVALVAVSIGLRLVYGEMSLFAGVLALVLAPEAFRPLRQVGAAFHDSADGVAATNDAFALVADAPAGTNGNGDGSAATTASADEVDTASGATTSGIPFGATDSAPNRAPLSSR
mgnify:CR=1 FL=1